MRLQSQVPPAAVARMLDRLQETGVCMHGFTLCQHGRQVAEGAWAPFQNTVPHRMYSISKSMTSLAVGLLQAQGRLRLSDPICDYFPDKLPPAVPGPVARLTIRDMLRMATCHQRSAFKQTQDDDWTRCLFTVPPSHEPGTIFCYDTSSSHTLAALAERLSGIPLLRFLQQNLFDSLGATDEKRWLTDPVDVSQGGSGLIMTLRDLTRVAQFCLEGGKGTPLEGYLREAVRKQIETPLQPHTEERFGYGYQFWRTRYNGFAMYGMGGQLAVCLPEHETVFCTVADTQLDPSGVEKIYNAFWQEVYPLLSARQSAAPGEWEALDERLRALQMPPVADTAAFACPTARDYTFCENPMGLCLLRLTGGALQFENAAGCHTLPFGRGAWARSVFPGTTEPCLTSAGWIAPGVLRLTSHLVGDTPSGMTMLLSFRGDALTVQMRSVREEDTPNCSGIAAGHAVGRG